MSGRRLGAAASGCACKTRKTRKARKALKSRLQLMHAPAAPGCAVALPAPCPAP